jgi:pimeloyl-ACP methyl ester carboxylesterase
MAARAGLDEQDWAAMEQVLADLGAGLQEVDVPALVARLPQKAMLVHSGDDRIVSIADSRETASRWPDAIFKQVDGLGHGRILHDPNVIALAVGFIAGEN